MLSANLQRSTDNRDTEKKFLFEGGVLKRGSYLFRIGGIVESERSLLVAYNEVLFTE